MKKISTELTSLLDIDYPIVMAPMFLVTNEKMMIEAMNMGIAACIPALNWRTDEQMRVGIAEIRNLIQGLAKDGRTIILASHLLDEVQKICTDFAVLRKGKKLYQGKVADLLQSNNRLRIASEDHENLKAFLEESPLVSSFQALNGEYQVRLKEESNISSFHKRIIESGIVLNKLGMDENSLERKFLEILKSE